MMVLPSGLAWLQAVMSLECSGNGSLDMDEIRAGIQTHRVVPSHVVQDMLKLFIQTIRKPSLRLAGITCLRCLTLGGGSGDLLLPGP